MIQVLKYLGLRRVLFDSKCLINLFVATCKLCSCFFPSYCVYLKDPSKSCWLPWIWWDFCSTRSERPVGALPFLRKQSQVSFSSVVASSPLLSQGSCTRFQFCLTFLIWWGSLLFTFLHIYPLHTICYLMFCSSLKFSNRTSCNSVLPYFLNV